MAKTSLLLISIFSIAGLFSTPSNSDIFDPEPNVLLDSTTLNFTHNILDEGFDPATDFLRSASLSMTFEDIPPLFVGDGDQEFVDVFLEGNFVRRVEEAGITGGLIFETIEIASFGLLGLLDDGLLDVTLSSPAGDELYFNKSELDYMLSDVPPPVDATPVIVSTFIDPEPNVFLDDTTLYFTHSLLDQGFDPATDFLSSASLSMTFEDIPPLFVGDGDQEFVDVFLEGNFVRRVEEAGITGGLIFETIDIASFGLLGLLDDGLLDVTLSSPAGDELYFNRSRLDATYLSAVVPIPATVWLFGSALIGVVCFSKRRKAD